jgi:hypothetical protein
MPTSPIPIDPIPTPVPTTTDPANFDGNADTLLSALPSRVDQMNAIAVVAYDNAVEAEASALAAADSVVLCEQAVEVANQVAGASMWNAATNYAPGDPAVSPTNMATYRRNAPGGVDATDPASSALWTVIGAVPVFASQAEAEAGTANNRLVSPLGVRQALKAAGSAPIFAARAFCRASVGSTTYTMTPTSVAINAGADQADVNDTFSATFTSGNLAAGGMGGFGPGSLSGSAVTFKTSTTFGRPVNYPGYSGSGNCTYIVQTTNGNMNLMTKNSTGNYSVTFITPITSRYVPIVMLGGTANTTGFVAEVIANSMTSTGFSFTCVTTANALVDPTHINIIVVGL